MPFLHVIVLTFSLGVFVSLTGFDRPENNNHGGEKKIPKTSPRGLMLAGKKFTIFFCVI